MSQEPGRGSQRDAFVDVEIRCASMPHDMRADIKSDFPSRSLDLFQDILPEKLLSAFRFKEIHLALILPANRVIKLSRDFYVTGFVPLAEDLDTHILSYRLAIRESDVQCLTDPTGALE